MTKLFLSLALLLAGLPLAKADSLAGQNAGQKVPDARSSEHCKTMGTHDVCYLEMQDEQGQVSFVMTEENSEILDLDLQKIQAAGIHIAAVPQEEYEVELADSDAYRIDYPSRPTLVARPRSWKCSLGIAGTMGGGGLAGAAFGPLGIIIGGISGAMAGAAASCF